MAVVESPSRGLPPGHPDEFLGRGITPAEQIRLLLDRKRRQGITDWDRVWPWAVGRVRWPHDREERQEWKQTITWAEPAFHAAYEREMLPVDMSALVIFEVQLACKQVSFSERGIRRSDGRYGGGMESEKPF